MSYISQTAYIHVLRPMSVDLQHFECINILPSNENATPKCASLSQGYSEYTLIEDLLNTKDRHHIDFISFNVKCPNVYTHAKFPTVVK